MKNNLKFKLENLKKAIESLNEAVNMYSSDKKNRVVEAGLIQNFEISVELSWKVMKKYLEDSGLEANTPRDAIKLAFSSHLIQDGENWLNALQDRNASSHIYEENMVRALADKILNLYFPLIKNFSDDITNKA